MSKIKWSYVIAVILMMHSLTGSILTFIKNPYGSDLNTTVPEFLAGAGIFRARKATDRLEDKVAPKIDGLEDPQ